MKSFLIFLLLCCSTHHILTKFKSEISSCISKTYRKYSRHAFAIFQRKNHPDRDAPYPFRSVTLPYFPKSASECPQIDRPMQVRLHLPDDKAHRIYNKFRFFRQHQKTMCKAFWNIKLLFVFGRKNNANPFSIGLLPLRRSTATSNTSPLMTRTNFPCG